MSQLQKDDQNKQIFSSQLFCGDGPWGPYNCLVNSGVKTESYFALRNTARCLNNGRNFHQLSKDDDFVLAAKEGATVYISSVNYGKTFTIDISQLGKTSGTVQVYEYDIDTKDELVATKQVVNGIVELTVPSQGSICAVVN